MNAHDSPIGLATDTTAKTAATMRFVRRLARGGSSTDSATIRLGTVKTAEIFFGTLTGERVFV
jgi:hypothetical protein